jgi:hypothetical protein
VYGGAIEEDWLIEGWVYGGSQDNLGWIEGHIQPEGLKRSKYAGRSSGSSPAQRGEGAKLGRGIFVPDICVTIHVSTITYTLLILDRYYNRCVNLPVQVLNPVFPPLMVSFVLNIHPNRHESFSMLLLLTSLRGLFQTSRPPRYQP